MNHSSLDEAQEVCGLDALFSLLLIANTITDASLCILARHEHEWGGSLMLQDGEVISGVDGELLVFDQLAECKAYNTKFCRDHDDRGAVEIKGSMIIIPVTLPNKVFYGCIYLSSRHKSHCQDVFCILRTLAKNVASTIYLGELLKSHRYLLQP